MEMNKLSELTDPFRLVPATDWGSEGTIPVGPCPVNPTGDPFGSSCVSGSGGSMCMGFTGHHNVPGSPFTYVKCVYGFTRTPDGRIRDEMSGRVFRDGRWKAAED